MVGLDDDADCVEHEWLLGELRPTGRGMERGEQCVRCGAVLFRAGQAAVRDDRPPL